MSHLGRINSAFCTHRTSAWIRVILSLRHKDLKCRIRPGISSSYNSTWSRVHVVGGNTSKYTQIRKNHVKPQWNLVYEGPLSKSVRYVKTFSLTTAFASIVGSPILVYFGKQSVPLAGKLAIAGLLCLVGTSTTILLHWFTKGYVHKMYFDPSKQMFSVDTLSFFGRPQRSEFTVNDVVFPSEESAFKTFEANGKPFFIHQEMVEAQQVLHYLRDSS